MGDVKWEDLPFDCLVNIFGRVGLESLIDGVPCVCKSWYNATLSPQCWQSLIIPTVLPCSKHLSASCKNKVNTSLEAFVKFVIRRSHGSVNVVSIPDGFSNLKEVIKCIGEGCPSLKRLELSYDGTDGYRMISRMICKWKNLEVLEISGGNFVENKIIPEISAHCKKIVSLSFCGTKVIQSETYAIAALLPNIEFLSWSESWINRSNIVIILKGCRKLAYFDAGLWFCYDVDDEIMNLVTGIRTFKFKVTKIECGQLCSRKFVMVNGLIKMAVEEPMHL